MPIFIRHRGRRRRGARTARLLQLVGQQQTRHHQKARIAQLSHRTGEIRHVREASDHWIGELRFSPDGRRQVADDLGSGARRAAGR